MKSGILTAYFARRDEAREALRALGRNGFRRAALIHKTAEGHVHTHDPFLRRRAIVVTFMTALAGGLAAAALVLFQWNWPGLNAPVSTAVSILAAGFVGAFSSSAWMRRSRLGVARKLLEDHSRWLATDETVLILQVPISLIRIPVAVLRQAGEIPPVISVLNPRRSDMLGDPGTLGAPLSPSQAQDLARRLAVEDKVDPAPRRNFRLLRRLRQARQWIHTV
jgi:hypothetical protein